MTRCAWAACSTASVGVTAGWEMCRDHTKLHHELVDPTSYADCGTITAAARHRRDREKPCEPCRLAERERKNSNYRNRLAS